MLVPAALVVLALAVYVFASSERYYNHFVWQAEAFLDGEVGIRYPVEGEGDSYGNAFFQDVLPITDERGVPTGRGLIPFPPLPALLLLPFVAIWGLATDQQLLSGVLGAIVVGIAWWVLGRLRVRPSTQLAGTVFFAFGTVFWYAAQIGTTWFFAHVVAVGFALLAVGVAIDADPASRQDEDDLPDDAVTGRGSTLAGQLRPYLRRPWALLDARQFVVGLLFGLAATARLTVLFAAPFFVLVGSGGSWPRRAVSAGLGALVPVTALIAYNLATTGHVFHPAYEHLYRLEAMYYTPLGYNLDWAIEDPRYIPQNLGIFLFGAPAFFPDAIPAALGDYGELCTDPGAVRRLFDVDCPIALPRDTGMSILLTSPAYLLALPALRLHGRSRLVTGAVIAVAVIAIVNLMHFSQGWVQFGYRFSNDFVPFALLLVAIGMEGRPRLRLAGAALIVVSVAINLWGVAWGNILGW